MVIFVKIFGTLVCCCLVAIYVFIIETGTRHADNRHDRVESLGAIVPMLGALLGILGFWLP